MFSDEEQTVQLQTLLGIARERSDMCNWEQNFRPVLLKLIELLEKKNTQLQVLSLRVLREMLKSKPDLLKDYTEMTVMKVLNTYCCEVTEVSQFDWLCDLVMFSTSHTIGDSLHTGCSHLLIKLYC